MKNKPSVRLTMVLLGLAGLAGWLALAGPTAAAAGDEDKILGVWVTAGRDTMVEISREGDQYSGKIVRLKEPNFEAGPNKGKPKTDTENPDPSLRSRSWIGLELLHGFHYEGGKWVGEIYDPESGDTYSCEITLAPDGSLDLRGYVMVSLLGRTERWEREKVYRERELKFLGPECRCE